MVSSTLSKLMDDISGYVPRDEEQVYEELYRPSVASRMEGILERLWEDPQFLAEVKERFEKGRQQRIYPTLARDLERFSDEQRGTILAVAGQSIIRSSLYLRTVSQLPTRSSVASSGRSADLITYASVVLESALT
jgi:hypothetical protein